MTKSKPNSNCDSPILNIRQLSPADFSAFWPVRLLALQESPQAFGAAYEESLALPEHEAIGRLSPKDGGFVLGAFGSDLLGIAGLARHSGAKVRHKGYIWGVYVVPSARGTGVARKLMERLLEQCRTIDGLEEVTLSVVTSNASAKGLYQSLGFAVYGLEKRALKIDGEYFDEELMALRF